MQVFWQHIRANHERTVELVGKVVEIVEYEDMVRLTVTHDELEAGSGMAEGVSKGWPSVLSSLKSFLETGRALDVSAKPKER